MAHSEQQRDQLSGKIEEAYTRVEKGAEYTHYKDPTKRYEVVFLAIDEPTDKVLVVYREMYGKAMVWVRTLEDFTSKVKLEDGIEIDRFKKIA
jgi:hypothetical protein